MHLPFRTALSFLALSGASVCVAQSIEPPRVIEQPMWNYPMQAAREMIYQGNARVLLSISEEGQVLDFVVLGYTHPAFAQEVASGLPRYRFIPARVRGEPATVRLPITFHFEQQGNVVSLSGSEQVNRVIARIKQGDAFQPTVCPGYELDGPLVPVNVVSPVYPSELRARGMDAEVMVDFYIDAEGRVRMPAAAPSAHPIFARMAIGALEQWTFEPPTSGGAPVLVHAKQAFRFLSPNGDGAKPAAAAAGGTSVANVEPVGQSPDKRF